MRACVCNNITDREALCCGSVQNFKKKRLKFPGQFGVRLDLDLAVMVLGWLCRQV